MALQKINRGRVSDDGTGDTLYVMSGKINDNFDALDIGRQPSKVIPVNSDILGIYDGGTGFLKRLSLANLANYLKSYFSVSALKVTGLSPLAGVVVDTDTLLTVINKIIGNSKAISASDITTGTLNPVLLPNSAIERLYIYEGGETLPENFGLTIPYVKLGDTVKIKNPTNANNGKMWMIVNVSLLNNPLGFENYAIGTVTMANLSGEVTSTGSDTTVTNDAVINKVLTGFLAATGSVSATDSILTAFNKVIGNLSAITSFLSDIPASAITSGVIDAARLPVSAGLQTGSVIDSYAIPSNALELNGQAVSRTTYADLFAILGTVYGVGDGSTTFNLPTSLAGLLVSSSDGTNLTATRSYHTATLLRDGRVLLIGGYVSGVVSNSTLFLTITGNSISYAAGTVFPTNRHSHTATLLGDDRVLVIGGAIVSTATATAYFMTISGTTIAYSASITLSFDCYGHTATLWSDGRVLVIGGMRSENGATSSTRFLTISGTTITPVLGTPLPYATYYHTATLLGSGLVLVTGGGSATTLFLTISGIVISYSYGAVLPEDRANHSANLLPNSKVSITGGRTDWILTITGTTIDYSFIYRPEQRGYHTATLLGDSREIIIGGSLDAVATVKTLFTTFLNNAKKYIKA